MRNEIERIRGVADMMCSAHANLRDRYAWKSLVLDLLILAIATWLIALAFVGPAVNISLTPIDIKPQIWSGLLAVTTFFLTLVEMKLNWKGRSEAHSQSLGLYSEVKLEANQVLALCRELEEAAYRNLLVRNGLASTLGAKISEREFLRQKKHHLTKVALSKYLDSHPMSSILITKARLWWRDNVGKGAAQ